MAEETAATKKKANSDSDYEDEENDNEQKEKGVSNKKKKVKQFVACVFHFVFYYKLVVVFLWRSILKKFNLMLSFNEE